MKKAIIITLAVIIFGLAFKFVFKKDKYIGFYYPDKNNLLDDIQSDGFFDSLDQCRKWVAGQVLIHNKENKDYDYECAKNCKIEGEKPYVCEETLY